MKVVKVDIDQKNPAVVAYIEAFKQGYAKLTEEQKAIFDQNAKETNINSPELKKLIRKQSLVKGIKSSFAKLVHSN
jgi:hypothetical protein